MIAGLFKPASSLRRLMSSRAFAGNINYEFPEQFRDDSFEQAYKQLCAFDPLAKQITPFPASERYQERYRLNMLKTDLPWSKPSPVIVHHGSGSSAAPSTASPHVFVGGLAPLFYAVRTAQSLDAQGSSKTVAFVNDGQYPIFKSSGLQLHTHGTQYTDYNVKYLLEKFIEENLRFLGLGKKWQDFHYDNLHLRLGKKFFEKPVANTMHYARFLLNQLHHDLFSQNGIGPNDTKLVQAVIDSLRFYRQLNEDIVQSGLRPIAALNGRLRMSYDKPAVDKYERKWNNLGIPTTRLDYKDLRQHTILRVDHLSQPLHAFAMTGDKSLDIPPDGHAKPHLMETIIEYAEKKFPQNFMSLNAQITDVHLCKTTGKAFRIDLIDVDTGHTFSKNVQPDFTASLGHNAVFKDTQAKSKPLYNEYTATGISMNFVLTVDVDKMVERQLGGHKTRDGVKKFISDGGLMPSADLCNLHVTIYDAVFEEDATRCVEVAKLFCRATEGANFNSDGNVADKRDFMNVFRKLHEFYDGKIELVSAGSCTRHTWLENMPRQDGVFLNGQSGVGVSYAGFDFTKWRS